MIKEGELIKARTKLLVRRIKEKEIVKAKLLVRGYSEKAIDNILRYYK